MLHDGRDEPWPPLCRLGQIPDADRCAGVEALHARALVGLKLHQLHPIGLLVAGGNNPQIAHSVGQQDPGRLGSEQLDAIGNQAIQQIDDVIVIDHRVGQHHERLDQQRFTAAVRGGHRRSFPFVMAVTCPY